MGGACSTRQATNTVPRPGEEIPPVGSDPNSSGGQTSSKENTSAPEEKPDTGRSVSRSDEGETGLSEKAIATSSEGEGGGSTSAQFDTTLEEVQASILSQPARSTASQSQSRVLSSTTEGCESEASPLNNPTLPDAHDGVRQLVGNLTVLSTMTKRKSPEAQQLLFLRYGGGYTDDSGWFWPTPDERLKKRAEEVQSGTAEGAGLLWLEGKNFEPVPLHLIEETTIDFSTPRKARVLTNLKDALSLMADDLVRIDTIIGTTTDFETVASISENLYIRARNARLPRSAAIFLELLNRSQDMVCLLDHRKEFFRALSACDVNRFYDSFFQTREKKEDPLFEQYVEQELGQIIEYCVCVSFTALDRLTKMVSQLEGGEGDAESL